MELLTFKYPELDNFSELTTVDINGEIWFVAPDVCKLLDISNVSDALTTLESDEKMVSVIPRPSKRVTVSLVNESGLYSLIFKSRKHSAREFRKWVTKEVIPTIRKTGTYSLTSMQLPNFLQRYKDNWHKIDTGYFSIITELFPRLYMRFEKEGYMIPDKALNGHEIRVDVSVGICFANYLREEYPFSEGMHKYYEHTFPNGKSVQARQYPNDLLQILIRYIDTIWIPKYAEDYFKLRDNKALQYLPKLLKKAI